MKDVNGWGCVVGVAVGERGSRRICQRKGSGRDDEKRNWRRELTGIYTWSCSRILQPNDNRRRESSSSGTSCIDLRSGRVCHGGLECTLESTCSHRHREGRVFRTRRPRRGSAGRSEAAEGRGKESERDAAKTYLKRQLSAVGHFFPSTNCLQGLDLQL